MAKITVDELVRGARMDALFDEEFTSGKARIRRALGEALFRLRKGRSLTQAALAESAGWAEPKVAKMERGDADDHRPRRARDLCSFYGHNGNRPVCRP